MAAARPNIKAQAQIDATDLTIGSLPPDQLALLELLATSFTRTPKHSLLSIVDRTPRPTTPRGGRTHPREVTRQVEALRALGLVDVNPAGVVCRTDVAHRITLRLAREHRLPEYEAVFEALMPAQSRWSRQLDRWDFALRDLRLAVYKHDAEVVLTLPGRMREDLPDAAHLADPLAIVITSPFDPSFIRALPPALRAACLEPLLMHHNRILAPVGELCDLLSSGGEPLHPHARRLRAEQALLAGDLGEAERLLAGQTDDPLKACQAWLALAGGDVDGACEGFHASLKAHRRISRKLAAHPTDLGSAVALFAWIRRGHASDLAATSAGLKALLFKDTHPQRWLGMLMTYAAALKTAPQDVEAIAEELMEVAKARLKADAAQLELSDLFLVMLFTWASPSTSPFQQPWLRALHQRTSDAGYGALAAECQAILDRIADGEGPRAGDDHRPRAYLIDTLVVEEAWSRKLDALSRLLSIPEGGAAPGATQRMAWLLFGAPAGSLHVEPRQQSVGKSGAWTRGRQIALSRLKSDDGELEWLTDADRRVIDAIHTEEPQGSWGYGQDTWILDPEDALPALIDHPNVLWGPTSTPLRITAGGVELLVKEGKKDVLLQLSPSFPEDQDVTWQRASDQEIRVYRLAGKQRELATLIGPSGLKVPKWAKDRVLESMAHLASLVTVQSNIKGAGELVEVEEIPPDARPCLRLLPLSSGLRIEAGVRPLGPSGAWYPPGEGAATVMAEIDGARRVTTRDPKAERAALARLVASIEPLDRAAAGGSTFEIPEVEEALEALEALQDQGDAVRLEWPQGASLSLKARAGASQLRLQIRRDNAWFDASGALTLDDGAVMDLTRILEWTARSAGRFIPLDEGRYLALTVELRKRLDQLRALSTPAQGGVRLHPLAAALLGEVTEGLGEVKGDRAWKEVKARLGEAMALAVPIPPTLTAELRGYQADGFRWLARTAHWGAGACLADDMGLGKTLQVLALLLHRAAQGPALVVAPTSVVGNWQEEALRFAPTLDVKVLGQTDRAATVAALEAGSVLVTSYGLLLQEAELLAGAQWATAVLDESQAIKNASTQRSQAALRLNADFRVATTGTPIENHLGELWTLFRFLNPGLLGSSKAFTQRFTSAIERHESASARGELRSLIQPFILRRTKGAVLKELPPRTEILIKVEPSPEEAALYEALRRQAVERLSTASGQEGRRHIQILAEIMKLRRAACNPRLVLPDATLGSCKLDELSELLEDVLGGNHRALIFSQFVDHLQIIRQHLEGLGISYQYLDGATPQKDRVRRVKAFQGGEGQVFLISLKAGGVGLNLTGADYVIHMDPWWNPAVEDQASDRAHRIGQTRPVTIYRLVVRGSIEEKIVALHQHKRDLADGLLEGTHVASQLTEAELLALLNPEP